MEIYHVPNQLIQILEYTGDDGIFSFAHHHSEEYETKLKSYSQRELTDHLFCLTQLYLNSDKFASKAYVKRLDPHYEVKTTEDTNEKYILFSANAIAYFGLPNINPKEELDILFAFFNEIKSIYSDFYQQFPDNLESIHMHIFNRSPSLFESLDFPIDKERKDEYQWLNNKAKLLLKDIKNNPTLTSWFKHNRRLLNVIGSHSWQIYNEESFFEHHENPLQQRWKEKPEEVNKMLRERKKKETEILKKRRNHW